MSEDAIKVELQGVRGDVAQLRKEGNERGKKLDDVLLKTAQVEVRVENLESDNKEYKDRFEKIESKIYKIGFWAVLALGGAVSAKEIISIF